MKVLIWIGCFFVATILNAILGYATGVKVGYFVFYFAVYFVAKKLCNKWDGHKEIKAEQKKATQQQKIVVEEKTRVKYADQTRFCRKCGEKLIDGSRFCRKCGSKVATRNKSVLVGANVNIQTNKAPTTKLVLCTNGFSILLTIISMLSIFVAMNIQDSRRNYYEDWNPIVVYFVLLLILFAFLCFAIKSLITNRFKLISCLSTIPVISAIIAASEGSIIACDNYRLSAGEYYNNYDGINVLNVIWIMCVILVLFTTFVPVAVIIIKKTNKKWHKSVSYREKCYKRVAKIHTYLEKGIITEEEYEKSKKEILKYIQ